MIGINYLATDEDGEVWGFECEPHYCSGQWCIDDGVAHYLGRVNPATTDPENSLLDLTFSES